MRSHRFAQFASSEFVSQDGERLERIGRHGPRSEGGKTVHEFRTGYVTKGYLADPERPACLQITLTKTDALCGEGAQKIHQVMAALDGFAIIELRPIASDRAGDAATSAFLSHALLIFLGEP